MKEKLSQTLESKEIWEERYIEEPKLQTSSSGEES